LVASRVDQSTSLFKRLAKAIEYSVLGQLSVLQEYKIGEVFADVEWRKIGRELIREAGW
jgi:hypothetical protein